MEPKKGKPKRRCTGTAKSTGLPCEKSPMKGSLVCASHGGGAPHVRAAAKRRLEEEGARAACVKLGIPIEVDPGEALMGEVWEAAGNVAFYRALVQDLPTHPGPDEYHPPEGEGSGWWERGEPGVYGRTYHVSGIPTGEAKPNVLVQLYNQERQHLAVVVALALKNGIEQRRIDLEQERASVMADVFRHVFEDPDLDLPKEKRRIAMSTAAKHLRLAGGTAA